MKKPVVWDSAFLMMMMIVAAHTEAKARGALPTLKKGERAEALLPAKKESFLEVVVLTLVDHILPPSSVNSQPSQEESRKNLQATLFLFFNPIICLLRSLGQLLSTSQVVLP